MQKSEAQHNQMQNQPAQRQGGGAALESPQGEQISQLEALADNSPQAAAQRRMMNMIHGSPLMAAQRKAISAIHNSPNVATQRRQLHTIAGETAQREEAPDKPNNTGLPDNLKSGIESLSGISMDSVRVHYNSSQPAQLNALAYAQGTDIHVAPGQEQHLPHEAWHVVQQAQGRVQPTMQMKEGVPANDDKSLEHEADVMGAKALQMKGFTNIGTDQATAPNSAGWAGDTVQRVGNEIDFGEVVTINGIHNNANTPQDKLTALEQSANQVFWYGQTAKTDEEAEITASASFLERRKADWRAELQHRANQQNQMLPAPENVQSWEAFQRGISAMAPNEQQIQPPWFMNQNYGYQLQNGGNQQRMQELGQGLANPTADDPQELLGSSYQRDTSFLNSQDMRGHRAQVNGQSTANSFNGWVNDVLCLRSNNQELRVRITAVGGIQQAIVVVGTVLASPAVPWGLNVGAAIRMTGNGFNGTLRIDNAINSNFLYNVANGWTGQLESWSYYQSMTVANDALGMGVQNADQPRARNRGVGNNLDDNTFNTVEVHYGQQNDLRGQRHTLGPWRTRLNFSDVGGSIRVAPYRRLGGDAIFNEAQHPNPGGYQNLLQPAANVNVNNVDWYYNQANAMPNRFVGGRSNSTKLYMGAATMLYHEGRLNLNDAKDVLAFVIADMVVSGEHSMPECMTTVTMVAGSSEPWTNTGVNLQNATGTLQTWFKLVNTNTKNAMYQDARQKLLGLLAQLFHDSKLVKVFVILDKMLYNELN